ncbi:glycosyltransferase family 2 protein [Neotabrizicola shimadae]|uniref:Glycosyltransferase family 2 protein n=1 Tax=Neotabrizicola shimadae TaxID=2807096 RepID=A0A8G0ZV28_9RHOB|nr:glycosyltransferase family 2 protein [Neotabrizicola shimadae]QYZ69218.1 glycosyltransferase family 2 protein [Neotabrizicola shimadae]
MTHPVATVLVPAWNESGVIGRTLSGLLSSPAAETLRIVVIANACTDATAAVARAAAPQALVLETPVPGKCHALNLGLAHADPRLPVVVLDADLQVGAADVLALVAPLRAGQALAACGRMDLSTEGASAPVRAWARAWARNPYFARGKFGGLFALSPMGVRRVFPLPPVTADDEHIRRSFAPDEIALASECRFIARAPRTLAALIRTRRRSLRGTRALRAARPAGEGAHPMLRAALAHPAWWPDLAVFLGVAAWVRLLLALEPRSAARRWERDTTTRESVVQP